jgi:hypothetical protein
MCEYNVYAQCVQLGMPRSRSIALEGRLMDCCHGLPLHYSQKVRSIKQAFSFESELHETFMKENKWQILKVIPPVITSRSYAGIAGPVLLALKHNSTLPLMWESCVCEANKMFCPKVKNKVNNICCKKLKINLDFHGFMTSC